MGDDLKKVQAGQPLRFPAGAYNAFIDAARDFQNRQRSVSSTSQPATRSSGIVLVRNDSAALVSRCGILGIDGPIIAPDDTAKLNTFQNQVALSGVKPTGADHAGRFVVLLEPLMPGKIGKAMASGVCAVQVFLDADDDGLQADVADGTTGYLAGASPGAAAILWRQGGTGVQWALVRIGCRQGLPSGGLRYQVLQRLDDDGAVGWEYPRFH